MESALVIAVGLASLAAGVGLGLHLRRLGAAAAAAEAAREPERHLAVLGERLRAAEAALAGARAQGEAAARTQAELQARVVALTAELARAQGDLDAERRAAEERRAEAERTREQVRAEVEKLASRLLEQQGRAMLERGREGLEALLRPLGERLRDFEQQVERTHATDTRERATLREQLRLLQEAQVRLHQDAEALTRALTRDSRQQGDWGEIVLERVLEGAGLTRGREYDLQVSHVDEDGGRKRPDALVYLPEDRAVVVDAKCSLTAFVAAARATSDAAREAALDAHLASVRAHVRGLAGKGYAEVLGQRSLDFVMAFVPSEAAFLAALGRAPDLWEEAFRQGVVLTSPTTLVAALRLVAQLWRAERQGQNARQIAEEAGRLLEKLAGFVADLDGVGARLAQAQVAFDQARARLATGKGNVLRRAARIAELGAPARTERVRALLVAGEGGEEDDEDEAGPRVG